jgi:ribosome maturation factor RimP
MRNAEISALIGEVVAAEGAELVDLQCAGSDRRPLLRAFVDIPGGTTVHACAELSRRIEARLEQSGLVGDRYVLEVSSPGLERPLRTRRDFERLRGHGVRVRTRAGAAHGERELAGRLEEVGGDLGGTGFWIRLTPAGREPLRIEAGEIELAKAQVDFERTLRDHERRHGRRGGVER